MKQLSLLLLFCAFLFSNCKEAATLPEEATNIIKTAPFENSDFKIERASTNLPESVTKIHFFDAANGVCLTENGAIQITNDRGLTWSQTNVLTPTVSCKRPYCLEIVDAQTIVGFAGAIECSSNTTGNVFIRSSDRGKTWATIDIQNTRLRSLTLGADNVLYAVGEYGLDGALTNTSSFFTSKDGGLTWGRTSVIAPFSPIGNIVYFGAKKLKISSTYTAHNPYLFTKDNGSTWEYVHHIGDGSEYIIGSSFRDDLGFYLSNVYEKMVWNVYQTIDNGEKWTNIRTINNTINEVKTLSSTTAVIIGKSISNNNPGFSYTFDAGKTWTDINLLDNLDAGQLITSSFYDAKNGYIVASKNVLYKMTLKK
jgi:photosystem II stability/assembly factor-like uncharacterized protein